MQAWQRLLTVAGLCGAALPTTGRAQQGSADIDQLRASLQQEITSLRQQEQLVHQQLLMLDHKSRLLDRQLQSLRGTGTSPSASRRRPGNRTTTTAQAAALPAVPAASSAEAPPEPAAAASSAEAATPRPAAAAKGESASIKGPSAEEQQARRVLESTPTLSNTGGVLTPRGQFIIDPSIEYDYWSQNQLGVNGFQIIPGITFGNIFVNRVEQNIATAAVTVRAGVTDRLELNLKVPYVYNETDTNSLIPLGASAQSLSVSASNQDIGDIQFGASYQINSGNGGWPVFVANFLYKSDTGVGPFDVPVYTPTDPNGQFLRGVQKRTATGTGFNTFQPNLTVLYPTAPGIFFGNLLFIGSLGRDVEIPDSGGGPPTRTRLTPGIGLALTFGFGFALNDRASMTLSYQQQHVFDASQEGHAIPGSAYSFGTFNFGLGYALSERTTVNASVGIGVGPNAPAARLLLEVPYRFSL